MATLRQKSHAPKVAPATAFHGSEDSVACGRPRAKRFLSSQCIGRSTPAASPPGPAHRVRNRLRVRRRSQRALCRAISSWGTSSPQAVSDHSGRPQSNEKANDDAIKRPGSAWKRLHGDRLGSEVRAQTSHILVHVRLRSDGTRPGRRCLDNGREVRNSQAAPAFACACSGCSSDPWTRLRLFTLASRR